MWPSRRKAATNEAPIGPATAAFRPSTGGRLVYAVGDIHGRADLLDGLLRRIMTDIAAAAASEAPILVFLGDYIDRGADSRGVIDAVMALRDNPRLEVHCLKGNHEHALLEFLQDPAVGPDWWRHGGRTTLASYGIANAGPTPEGWKAVRDAFDAALPADHRAFFESLELSVAVGDYLFVHAGVRPSVPLDRQSEEDLMWIRHDFLGGQTPLEKVVVHGHTPVGAPFADYRRICVDTGAYATGILSAVRLEGEQHSFIQEGVR